jgi:hypothetical protein
MSFSSVTKIAIIACGGIALAQGCESNGNDGDVRDRNQTQHTNPDGSQVRTRTQVRETDDGQAVRETETQTREPVSSGTSK